jgi:hypothetical protein
MTKRACRIITAASHSCRHVLKLYIPSIGGEWIFLDKLDIGEAEYSKSKKRHDI